MRRRPSSRLLVVNGERQVLLFRFAIKAGPLPAQTFWATPGGAVDEGESYEDAARRELFEEVGLEVEHPGPQIAQRTAVFAMPSGETVEADERYFLVRVGRIAVSNANRTPLEREVIAEHRWWSEADLAAATEPVWPETLAAMLAGAGVWAGA